MTAPLGLTIRSNLADMKIGDCIPCRYTATTSGAGGYFSELGICAATEIPLTGTATPDGLFYFIKVAKGLLIADRVIQSDISWDILNTAKFIEGKNIFFGLQNIAKSSYSITASSTNRGPAINAFDENDTTFWGSNGNETRPLGGHWIKIKLPQSTRVDIFGLSGSTDIRGLSIGNFEIYGSNDDHQYSLLTAGNHKGDNSLMYFNNTQSEISYQYYRLNLLNGLYGSSYSSQNEVGEFKLLVKTSSCISWIIRSLSGGSAYADANGNMATTDKGFGGWPINNEWDKYIAKSTLGGKILAGDNNVWNWNNISSLCKETPITDLYANTYRVMRAYNTAGRLLNNISSYVSTSWGFRPVLEYMEPDGSSKQTTLWY